MAASSRATLALRSLAQDMSWGWKAFVTNSVAGSVLCPRVVRYSILRARGFDVRTANISPGCTFTGGRDIQIGSGSFVNVGCYFEAVAPIRIGQDCQVAMSVTLVTSFHALGAEGVTQRRDAAPVTIGRRCWLGANVIVLPGVTIGDDVVIAAGAVVTRNLRSGAVYGGVPARFIRTLVADEGGGVSRPASPQSLIGQ